LEYSYTINTSRNWLTGEHTHPITNIFRNKAQHNTQKNRIQPTNSNTHAQQGDFISSNRRQQFPRPIILTPDDDHTETCSDKVYKKL
jgi:hypothetical protein